MIKRQWVVAYVIGNNEMSFAAWMNERGIQAYVVSGKKQTKPLRKKKPLIKEAPAFTSYVFVHIKTAARRNREWGVMRMAPGFLRVITDNGGEPTIVPERAIRELWDMQERGEFNHKNYALAFVRGTPVGIKSGPYQFASGVVTSNPQNEGDAPIIEVNGSKVKIHVSLLEISGNYPHPGLAG